MNKNPSFRSLAIAAGYPASLVEDFFQACANNIVYRAWDDSPTLDRLEEYKRDQDSSYNAQVRWDTRCKNIPTIEGLFSRGISGV